jgi:hypothetical protein
MAGLKPCPFKTAMATFKTAMATGWVCGAKTPRMAMR